MDIREAKEIVAHVCRSEGELWASDHFWTRARERFPDLTIQHVFRILRTGEFMGAPVPDKEHHNHVVRIQATLPDYGTVRLVAGLSLIDGVVCITVYGVKKGTGHAS